MAPRPAKVTHVVGGTKLVQLEEVYEDIGTICGITVLGEDEPPAGSETSSIEALVKSGFVRRAKVRIAETKKLRTIYIIAANCPQIGALIGKDYMTEQTIKTAYFPQKYTFSGI